MITSDNKNGVKISTAIVVDDDYDVVDAFSEYLEIKGIRVLGKGYNGKEAVDLYKKLKPDVVFLDVIMPDYTGFYALEKIKQINPDAKVIMVTADLTEETENKLVDLHASYIAYKPIELDNMGIIGGKKE
jgi:two-component system chemotaxis response regulator CheY/two-component system response regulator (stage 0 sporulation protein A)